MKPLVRRAVAIAAVLAVSAATFYSVTRGRHLQLTAPEVFLGAAPFVGRDFRDGWDWRFAWSLVGAIVILSATALATLRGWWWRVRVGWVVAGAAIGAGAFGVLLALTDGFDGLTHGAADPSEYWANLSKTPPAGEFLRTFVAHLGRYSVHVRGHPPGFTLLLKLLGAADLSRVWPVAGLSILGAVALPIGVLITVRAVAGDDWVRRSAPFLVVSPYAIWLVTSADSLYAAVGAVGVAAIAVSLRAVLRRCAVIGGLFGGVLLGLLIFGTYLGVLVGLVAIGCAFGRWRRDRWPSTSAAVEREAVRCRMTCARHGRSADSWFSSARCSLAHAPPVEDSWR